MGMMKGVVLVGFMGAGKSSVGQALAERLGIPFVDTDARIERDAGRTVSQIFAEEGEAAFRKRESETMEWLAAQGACVVATGGGVVTRQDNWPRMRRLGPVVHLKGSAHILFNRVRSSEHRPLLRTPDPRAAFDALFNAREPLYERADLAVSVENKNPADIAAEIAAKLRASFS